MAKKQYISLGNLRDFLDNLKNKFAEKVHRHTVSDIEDYVVDSELSSTSTNPVQNKVINEELDAVSYAMNALETFINQKSDSDHNHDSDYDAKGTAEEKANAVQANLNSHIDNDDIHFTAAERTKLSGIATGANKYTHPTSGVTAGTYKSVTVDANGHVTAGTNPTTLAGYGITDAETKGAANTALASAQSYTDDAITGEVVARNSAIETAKNSVISTASSDATSKADSALAKAKEYTNTKVTGLASTTVVDNKISTHNTSSSAHSDIRDLISDHAGDPTIHVTSSDKTNWNAAYNHSTVAHAPGNAQPNQNAFSKVVANGTTVAADTTEDTLTIAAGTGIAVTGDATNDKVTITNAGVRSITTGTANGTINVNTNGTTANVAVKGLGSAAYTASTDYASTDHGHILSKITDVTATATEVNILDGATVSTTELNYLKGVTSSVQTQIDSKADDDHNHDDRYYTEEEVNNKLAGKADKSHGNHVPATQTASNSVFLRNDNTWATVTPANIGAAASSHTHDDRYYTEEEVNNLLSGKASTAHHHNNDYYGKAAGETLASTLAEVKEDVDAFFKDATISADAKDTLKEIQEYIATDASAAAAMTASINNKADKEHTHTNYASTVTTTGSGNAITAISQSGNTITATKGATFLTAHPAITTQAASTSAASPAHGKTFTAIDSITKDSNGHVTQINTKTVTLPSETNLSTATATTTSSALSHSGTFKAITGLNVDGHKITPVTTTFTLPADNNTTYSIASSTTAGLVKVGYTASGKNYPVQLEDGKMYVNVPWTDTDTNTHYASKNVVGTSTATSNTTAALTNGNVYLNSVENGAVTSTHKISGSGAATVTTDASGNIIVSATDTNTTYSAGTGISFSGTTINNSGVRSIATGTSNGTINVNTNGTTANVMVKGLGSAAYASSTSFAASSHSHTIANVTNLQGTLESLQDQIDDKAAASHIHTVSHTPAGTVNSKSITPAGTISNKFTGTASSHSHTFSGTAASHGHTFNGTSATIKSGYTPAGSVASTFSGTAKTSTTASATTTVYSITGVGSAPSLTASVDNKCLTLSFSAGSVPTRSSVTVPTSGHTHSVTATGTITNKFTGTASTISATYTPAGTIAETSITPAGSIGSTSITPAGSVASTFSGTAASHDHGFTGTAATLTTSTEQ